MNKTMNAQLVLPGKQTKKIANGLLLPLLFVLLSAPVLLSGMLHQFKHISLEEGLSQSAVFCILQDSKGFLWMGTQDGLNKYDGYDFVIFKTEPGNLKSLSYNWINTLYEDDSGNIWIGTNGGGLNRYDPKTETFTRYSLRIAGQDGSDCEFVNTVCCDSRGVVWIGTAGSGLYRLYTSSNSNMPASSYPYPLVGKQTPQNGVAAGNAAAADSEEIGKVKIENISFNPGDPGSLAGNTVNAIIQDTSGEIWVGTNNGLDHFNKESGEFIHYTHSPGKPGGISDNNVNTIYEDQSKRLWIGTANGLNIFNKVTGNFSYYLYRPGDSNCLSNYPVSSILQTRSGIYWIGTSGGGLNRLDNEKGIFTHFRHNDLDPYSISSNHVFCLLEDRSGILWLGTSGKGLEKLNREEKFRHYQHLPDNPNSLSDNYVYAICEDKNGILWIGTRSSGLNRLDRITGTYTHFRHDDSNPSSIGSNSIRKIFEDRSGTLWIATRDSGLDRFNPGTGTFTHFGHVDNNPSSISSDALFSIVEDSRGQLWIGSWGGGLNRFDRKKGTFSCYRHSKYDSNSLGGDQISIVYEAPSEPGILWIGTRSSGLSRFDIDGKIFTRFQSKPDDPHSLSTNFVLCIYEDHSGTLWIGTHSGGLNKMTGRKKGSVHFIHYTEKNGLPNNSIYGILEDNAGNLWISTNNGLSKFDPKKETFKNYNQKDGLQANEFNGGAYFKSQNGELFFGGINGLNAFFPDNLQDNPYIPPVVITSLRVNNLIVPIGGRSPMQQSVPYTDKIELSYRQNSLSFEFAALDYTIPENNAYAYKMEGFDSRWNYTNAKKRFAYYTNLDSGDYVFRVIASNNDGVWNKTGTSVHVTILPPFWKTWWFITILLVIALVLLLFFTRLRVHRVERKSREAHEQVKMEMERRQLKKELEFKADFMAMLVHDLRGPLTAVTAFANSLNEFPDKRRIKKIADIILLSSKKMMDLINNMLDLSKFEAGQMTLERELTPLMKIIGESVKIMSPLFEQKKVSIDYIFPGPPGDIQLNVDPGKIGQVLNNLLSNAIKYTPEKGKVTIGLHRIKKHWVEVWIKDNGPGIPLEKQQIIFEKYSQLGKDKRVKGTGLGLAVSKMIIEAHGGIIGCRSAQEGNGSILFFQLPL